MVNSKREVELKAIYSKELDHCAQITIGIIANASIPYIVANKSTIHLLAREIYSNLKNSIIVDYQNKINEDINSD